MFWGIIVCPQRCVHLSEQTGACPLLGRRGLQPQGRHLRPFLSFSTSLAFPGHSLTSLIYGEQSEKTSPSDISLEIEHKDKVGAKAA